MPQTLTPGMTVEALFTGKAGDPYAGIEWEKRTAAIYDDKGEAVFEQRDVEVPKAWSQTAANIVASKYLHGSLGTPQRETSVRHLVGRVVDSIASWGIAGGYFGDAAEGEVFRRELAYLMLHQMASFNSPVWFNVGIPEGRGGGWHWDEAAGKVVRQGAGAARPQCSACFILSVKDSLESILELAKTEGMLFKWGSGCGTNLSVIREQDAVLAGGGKSSGPLSFMRGYDAFAGVIKSGGKTRRAAKMVMLDVDHPDIEEFILCKSREEKKAQALIDAGYDGSFDGEAYRSVFFQNANNSVRVSDVFMEAAVGGKEWVTRRRVSGEPGPRYEARKLLETMAEAAHGCGDPGVQFDTTINRWHTSKASGAIRGSNPCSEYMFLDDSACNLASLNLMRFLDADGEFATERFLHAVDLLIRAQEILVDASSYPTEAVAKNSHDFRPLGLGYANLGGVLLTLGLPYDSDAGRQYAAGVTALMTGQAYLTSARLAGARGAFAKFAENREAMLEVMHLHQRALRKMDAGHRLAGEADEIWNLAISEGERHGYRNAQVTVLAPTGTIGFMMDCDTTGIEPELALVKHKRLSGGGTMRIVNRAVGRALERLGYSEKQVESICAHVDRTGTIEGAPDLDVAHLDVFDCSLRAASGTRAIAWRGHLRMMAAVQPFLSGAISKTINMPEESTVGDVYDAYVESWRLGLKAVAIYRDHCKRAQPLDTGAARAKAEQVVYRPLRRRLPDERRSLTHRFSIGGHEGYITAGLYDDGSPGEIFVTMSKEGSTISGLMDCFATAVSLSLQYGVPLQCLVDKFSHMRFEPSGFTGNPQLPYAKSIMDYIFRWLELKFLEAAPEMEAQRSLPFEAPAAAISDAPLCPDCGSLMVRNGSCYKCGNCGGTSGCS